MLIPDKDYFDQRLGMLKLGVLLARKAPDMIDKMIECASLEEVAVLMGIPGDEKLSTTAERLLREWLED